MKLKNITTTAATITAKVRKNKQKQICKLIHNHKEKK